MYIHTLGPSALPPSMYFIILIKKCALQFQIFQFVTVLSETIAKEYICVYPVNSFWEVRVPYTLYGFFLNKIYIFTLISLRIAAEWYLWY